MPLSVKISSNCLSSHSCHFVDFFFTITFSEKLVFGNDISSCKFPMGLHHVDIKSSNKNCGRS